MENLKEEMKNNDKVKTIQVKEVNFEQYRNTGAPQQSKGDPSAYPMQKGLAHECAIKDE